MRRILAWLHETWCYFWIGFTEPRPPKGLQEIMLNANVRRGGIAMHPSVSSATCPCGNHAFKEGWCVRCYPLYGDAAWKQVGKQPQLKAKK